MTTPTRYAIAGSGNIGSALAQPDFPEAGDQIADLVGNLGLSAVQLGRTDEGGLLIQTPNALVLRNLIERPLH